MSSCQPSGKAGIELELCILLPKPAKRTGLTRKDRKDPQQKNGKNKNPVKCAWQVTTSHQTSRARQKFIGEEGGPTAATNFLRREHGGPMASIKSHLGDSPCRKPSNSPGILRVNSTLDTLEMAVLCLMLLSRCHEIQLSFLR